MRNGIEYSKSKKFRILKETFIFPIEYHHYVVQELVGDTYVAMRNGPWDYLNNARYDMSKLEALVCPQ